MYQYYVDPSIRGGILRLLGILSDRYKEANEFSTERLKKLSKLYTQYIHEALNDPNKMERSLVGGCLTGLEYFLNEYSHLIPFKAKKFR